MSDNTTPKTGTMDNIQFNDIFNPNEIQHLQDLFSETTGVASIIAHPDGKPITKPSNFCDLCANIMRKSYKGLAKCYDSNELLGMYNPGGPLLQPCLGCGMWNAGASITVGNKHLATWLIGQVRTEEVDDQLLVSYADDIGADREEFIKAYRRVPFMPLEQFRKVSGMLFAYANEISEKAYSNLLLKRQIAEHEKTILEKKEIEEQYKALFELSNDAIFSVDLKTGIYLNVNKAAEILTGRSLAELKKLKTSDLTPKEASKRLKQVADSMKTLDLGEVDYLRPDQSVRTAVLSSIPVNNGQVFGIARDVTDRNSIEQSLQKSEKLYRSLFENMLNGFAYCQMHFDENDKPCDFTYVSVNSAFETLTGLKDVVGKKATTVIPGIRESDPELLTRYGRVSKSGKPEIFEMFVASMQMWFFLSIYSPEPGYFVAVFDVITERKQAEEALKYSLSLNEATIESIHNGILVVNDEGKVIKTNSKFAEMWQIPSEILSSGDDKILIGSVLGQLSDPDGFIAKVAELYEKPEAESLDVINLKDGRIFKRISKPMHFGGKPKGRVWSFLDITERIKAEEALLNSKAHLHTLVQTIPDLIWLKDPSGAYLSCNTMFERMVGASEAEIMGKTDYDLFDRENADMFRTNDRKAIAAGKPSSNEEWLKFADDGHRSLLDVIKTPMFDSRGTLTGVLGIGHDITKRKQSEESLHASQQLIEGIINAIPVRIFWKDSKGIYLGCNTIFANDAGFSDQKDIIGKDDFQMGWRDQAELYRSGDRQVMESGNPILLNEEPQTTPEGNTIILLTNKIPLKNSMGEIYGILGTSMNITERMAAVEQIELKNEELTLAHAEKDKFFSIIAHDLRSPFSSFLGLTQIMDEEMGNLSADEIQEITHSMRSSASNLYQLLENLLQWSRMHEGLMPFKPTLLQLAPIVEECMAIAKETARNKGIELICHVQDGVEVFADLNILLTVTRNLVSNALKFTNTGGTITLTADVNKDYCVRISIKDTGIGMTSDMVDNLFRIDVQTRRTGTAGEPSTGLGLLLCKEFIERNGGHIRVKSEVGQGSEFQFTIPCKDRKQAGKISK